MQPLDDLSHPSIDRVFDDEGLAAQMESLRRKRRRAYPRWLLFGSHYLYLGRPFVQLLFWATLGGLLVWWIADLFRMPRLVERRNDRLMRDLLKVRQVMLDQYLRERAPWSAPAEVLQAVAPSPVFAPTPESVDAPIAFEPRRGRFAMRRGPGLALAASLATIVGVHLFAPPDRYPRASVEPAYRTLRPANVREGPSLKSPVVAKVGRDVLLRGEVQLVAASGPSEWLRITSGTHFDRYVAVQNLEKP